MQQAKAHGFSIDIEDNGMLIYVNERTTRINTPGQWAIAEMIADAESKAQRKVGRPRKGTYAA